MELVKKFLCNKCENDIEEDGCSCCDGDFKENQSIMCNYDMDEHCHEKCLEKSVWKKTKCVTVKIPKNTYLEYLAE